MRGCARRWCANSGLLAVLAAYLLVVGGGPVAEAARKPRAPAVEVAPKAEPPATDTSPAPTSPGPPPAAGMPPAVAAAPAPPLMPRETVEADVSTRSVAITSAFRGTEIVVFGTVNHSRQESAEAGLYDVVVVAEGAAAPLVARKKSNVGGIWLNTSALRFDRVPSFYAIASTRPIDEVADADLLRERRIGFEHARIDTAIGAGIGLTDRQKAEFAEAVIRLKRKEGLFIKEDYAVTFVGRALFRATIGVPSNVPVGTLVARVFLFRDGELLSEYATRVQFARQGLDNIVYLLAFSSPLIYGIVAVAFAIVTGLLASAVLGRKPS